MPTAMASPIVAETTRPTDQSIPSRGPSSRQPAQTPAAEAIAQLPPDSRRAVSAAHGLFAELSRRLRRTPAAQIRRTRIRVPDARKAVIIVRALGGRP